MLTELLWTLPFVSLLGAIAILPLVHKEWWEKNFLLVSFSLAVLVGLHYVFQLGKPESLMNAGFDYFSFICLIGSLFVVSGGIHINVKGEATPFVNSAFLFIGAVLASLIGTTGASMVMIRPWIRMNKYRITAYHIVFFIFIVSNIGGGLTPVGDPPLFLGYLKGVPFFWVLNNVWPIWLLMVGVLILAFFIMDTQNFEQTPLGISQEKTSHEEWKFLGGRNIVFLAMILGSVFLNQPRFLREGIMLLAAILSYLTTPRSVHESNDFSFGPIKEVAILFFGIFATMIPALEWLEKYALQLGIHTPGHFFWGSGVLSSVLDNAPTYLNFLSVARGLFGAGASGSDHAGMAMLLQDHANYIRAISVGSVFFGAVTYIGNGPNFLVKSIAEQAKVKTPSFFGYFFKYSVPFLMPSFFLIWYYFFRI
jgi:Na+/H+ antiporter NhaD/arsenite permease-like protein